MGPLAIRTSRSIVTYMKVLKFFALTFGFLFLINPLSCASIQTSNSNITPIIAARDSFVKLVFQKEEVEIGSASGVIIHHSAEKTLILSAGHVCDDNTRKSFAIDLEQQVYEIDILKVSDPKVTDLCVFESRNRIGRDFSFIAKEMVKPGDKAYNLSAPLGIHGKNMVLQFEGYYSGRFLHPALDFEFDLYTIPTKGGSSGSPIFNKDWEVIGITSRASPDLENIGMMVPLEEIHKFLLGVASF